MTRRSLPTLLLLLPAACAGPPVKLAPLPPASAPAAWRTDLPATVPIDRAWWNGFADPALIALVEQALANNSDIGVAIGRVREARANVRAARATLFPTLDAGIAGGRDRSVSAFGTPEVQTFGEPQAQAAYEVDLFGRLADQRAAARNAYFASQGARDAVRLAVASGTASAYITLLGLDSRLDIARRTLVARRDSLRIANSRVSNGYSPKLELQQAQAEYDATAAIIPQIQLAVARIENGLNLLTGNVPGAIARGRTLETLAQPAIPEGLPSELLTRRPDIASAEYQLAAADRSLAAARKRFLPRLSLSGSAGTAISTLLADPITIWSAGGSILAPIFEGGRLAAQSEAAGGQRDQAALAYRRAVLTGFREVEDALASVERLDQQLVLATHQRDSLAESVRLATNRYREGYSPYLDQLDAQRQLLSAELNLAQVRADAFSARVALFQALGGGWSKEDVVQK